MSEFVALFFEPIWCRLVGHQWEASVYPEPHNDHIEAWWCKRCGKVEYPAVSKAETP